MQGFRYAKAQVAVHWLAAALVVFLLLTGTLVLADSPNTDVEKICKLRVHMILGGIAGLLVFVRVIMRRRFPLPPQLPGHLLSVAGFMALNLLVLLLVFSGVILALQSGAFDAVFGSGVLPEDFRQFPPRKIHGLASRVAMGLIALHGMAALWHQFVLKDGLLSRMRIGR